MVKDLFASADPRDKLCLALDTGDLKAAVKLASHLSEYIGWSKIGIELYTAHGPDAVTKLLACGVRVFLDLKLHDIPNTVGAATREAVKLGASMLNVHSSGGLPMLKAARSAADEFASDMGIDRPLVMGVTLLTSISAERLRSELRVELRPEEYVIHLADLCRAADLDGVVASPQEARRLREHCGTEFKIVTPGIRRPNDATNDQARTMSPAEALHAGADLLVIGRPVTTAVAPLEVAREIWQEAQGFLTSDRSSEYSR